MRRDAPYLVSLASRVYRSTNLEATCSSSHVQGLCAIDACNSADTTSNLLVQCQQRRWMAVPKRKTSPHRRGMRNATKYLRRIDAASKCGKCGAVFGIMDVHFCKPDRKEATAASEDNAEAKQLEELDWDSSRK